jgi:hypothetical protein
MASLQSDNFVIDKTRVNLYYDKFEYKIQVYQDYMQYFRYARTVSAFTDRLENEVIVRSHKFKRADSWIKVRDVCAGHIEAIREFIEIVEQNSSPDLKVTISDSKITYYSNDLAILNKVTDCCASNHRAYDAVRVVRLPNFDPEAVYHKEPKHKYRMYLASHAWPLDERRELSSFLRNNTAVYPSQTLRSWCTRENPSIFGNYKVKYTWTSMFIDYDDEQQATYMALKFPYLIGKLCRIEKR